MSAEWFIEAQPKESWREASRLFRDWLSATISLHELEGFGWSEGDAVTLAGRFFHGFHIPQHHAAKVALFETWAKTTGRSYGQAIEGTIRLNDGGEIVLPPRNVEVPPWLR